MPSLGSGEYGSGPYGGGYVFWPTMILEWAPADPPSAEAPTWVDITDRLYEWEWAYGRNDETGEFEPGRGYVLLNNRDRALDPLNTAGPWYGNIKPRRKFRMRCTRHAVTYPVFQAHARGYPQHNEGEHNETVRVDLADALAILKAVDLDALGFNRPVERSDERVGALLDAAGIPNAERSFGTGTVTVAATSDNAQDLGSAQQHIQQVTASEDLIPYVGRDGLFYAT